MEYNNLPHQPRPRNKKELRRSLRKSVAFACENRWWSISVAKQNTLATTLFDAPRMLHTWDGTAPPLGYLLHVETPAESRLFDDRERENFP